jgi:psp operon transcriptional activator
VSADARLIAAANTDLSILAAEGTFKRDLLDRLSFEVLFLPPLRERRGDVMLLAGHFAARMAHELGRGEIPQFSDQAIAALESYAWPGNVRELKNVVERAVYRSESDTVAEIVFDPFQSPYAPPRRHEPKREPDERAEPDRPARDAAETPATYAEAMRERELSLLRDALERSRYNQRDAAKLLGLTYHQFRGIYRKRRRELTPPES